MPGKMTTLYIILASGIASFAVSFILILVVWYFDMLRDDDKNER